MRLLDRVRGLATPEARADAARDVFKRVRATRVPLYQNDARIRQVYEQQLPNVTQTMAEVGLSVGASGGVVGLVNLEGERTQSQARTIEMTPLLQALLLEESARDDGTLVDLSAYDPARGSLLRFVGGCRVFFPSQPVSEIAGGETLLGNDRARALQAARQQQENAVRDLGTAEFTTVVWVWPGARPIACIAGLDSVHTSNLRSYREVQPHGVLGLLETRVENVVLLAPLLIWHETKADED